MKSSLLTCLCLLLGCFKTVSKPEQEKKVLRLNIGSEVSTLDPRKACDGTSSVVIWMLYDGLVRNGQDKEPVLSLARDVEISADQKSFTFHLKDTSYANGRKIVAQDFVNTLQACLDPQDPSGNLKEYFILKNAKQVSLGKLPPTSLGVKALSEDVVQFELERPCPHFLSILCNGMYSPLPYDIDSRYPNFTHCLDTLKVNNGPFIVKEWKHREKIVLQKNPLYWDSANVHMDEIVIEMVEDQMSELELFKKGLLDYAGGPLSSGLPFQALEELDREKKLQIANFSRVYWYFCNVQKEPLNNINFRKALAYAIDRQRIIDHIIKYGAKAANSPFPPGYQLRAAYFQDNQQELARSHLALALEEMGLNKEDIHLKLSLYNSSNIKKIAEAVCYQWQQVLGLDINIEFSEWGVFLDKMFQRNFDLGGANYIPTYDDVTSLMETFKEADSTSNVTGWENPDYIHFLNKAQNCADREKRKEYLLEAEKIIGDELPVIPVYYSGLMYIKNERLEGFVISKTGLIDFTHAYFK